MQTDVPDVSGYASQEEPSLIQKIVDVLKDDIVETIQTIKETDKLSKL